MASKLKADNKKADKQKVDNKVADKQKADNIKLQISKRRIKYI